MKYESDHAIQETSESGTICWSGNYPMHGNKSKGHSRDIKMESTQKSKQSLIE